jgi:hypothetical protein
MADQYGYPVVDIYVDARPPYAPEPRVSDMSTSSVSFTWDPVSDQGDGAGKDYFASGMGHYSSWLTLGSSRNRLHQASTSAPRTLVQSNMKAGETACAHVIALDKLLNATNERVACAGPLAPPPMPDWSAEVGQIVANPTAPGLVGLDSLFWLRPTPQTVTVHETYGGVAYAVTAVPTGSAWDFGDGGGATFLDQSGFGRPYPQASAVTHVYQAHAQAGYLVKSAVSYSVSWTASINGRTAGPYPLGTVTVDAQPLLYPVEQAQPELISGGQVADQPLMPATATATTGPPGIVARYWE